MYGRRDTVALYVLHCCYIPCLYTEQCFSVFHPGTSRCHSLGLFPTACSVHVQGSAIQVCHRSQTSAFVTTVTHPCHHRDTPLSTQGHALVTTGTHPCHHRDTPWSPQGHVLVSTRPCPCHHKDMSLSPRGHVLVTTWSCPCHHKGMSCHHKGMSLPSRDCPSNTGTSI